MLIESESCIVFNYYGTTLLGFKIQLADSYGHIERCDENSGPLNCIGLKNSIGSGLNLDQSR